ncbi:recombinase family protein [Candidatus Roizmanbacteria bacterium]|nr:recombinase family protein [Candidatus Roizmanbacteria bacterium]
MNTKTDNKIKMEDAITINRISSQRQDDGYSLPQQAKANLEKANKDGSRVIKEFSIIESAKASEKRDDFNEAVEYIKKHRNIKFVYIEKPDRLTRNLKDATLAYELVYDYDVTFIFTRDILILNKNSNSHAKFQFDIKAVLAKNYIDNLSDEVKKGQRGMLEEGKWPGGASPTGYKKVDKLLVPDKPRDSYVVKTFELYASGSHSLKSLKREMDKHGFRSQNGKPLTKSNYYVILTNPIYYGMMRWNGHLYEGKHQPLIVKQLFDKVQEMLARTKNGEVIPVYAKHDVTYRGTMVCGECGCKITADEKTKKNKGNGKVHRWVYYHCTHYKPCNQIGAIREEEIDRQIVELLSTLSLGKHTTEWLKNKLKESHQDEVRFREDNLTVLNNNLTQVRTRLDRVYDDKIDGVIDEDTYHRKREQYLSERADVENQIQRHTIADDKYVDFGCMILDVANRASDIYKVRNADEKRYLINLVFSNLSLEDKKLKFSLKNIFQAVLQYQKNKDWLGD